MRLHLITGGARSGKSTYAELLAQRLGGQHVLYIATAEPGDAEMEARIAAHRQRRPACWTTLEVFHSTASALRGNNADIILLDCLTLLTSNVFLRADTGDGMRGVADEIDALLQAAASRAGELIVVTNEIGLGIVPDNALARAFRDALGWANQRVAAAAESVTMLVCGIPLVLKVGQLPFP
jgi:adenosyl cobinamide kinase/adenosyl cobinamide phosphate guanylyltransferase